MLHSVMSVFQSSPKEPFNYKQISKLIGVESQVQKLQVVDLLYDLSAENFITEIDRGRYRYNGLGTTAVGTFGRRSNGKTHLFRKMAEHLFCGRAKLGTCHGRRQGEGTVIC